MFAAVLLTSIPAIGDYVNASVLGGPGTAMIGNVIQSEFLTVTGTIPRRRRSRSC